MRPEVVRPEVQSRVPLVVKPWFLYHMFSTIPTDAAKRTFCLMWKMGFRFKKSEAVFFCREHSGLFSGAFSFFQLGQTVRSFGLKQWKKSYLQQIRVKPQIVSNDTKCTRITSSIEFSFGTLHNFYLFLFCTFCQFGTGPFWWLHFWPHNSNMDFRAVVYILCVQTQFRSLQADQVCMS